MAFSGGPGIRMLPSPDTDIRLLKESISKASPWSEPIAAAGGGPSGRTPAKSNSRCEGRGTGVLSHPITAAHTVIIASYIPWPIIRESVVQFRIFIRKKHSSAPISPVKAA